MTELIQLEDLENLSQEDLIGKLKEANEAYKNLESNTERGVQKTLEEVKLGKQALKAIKEINGDNEKFIELYESDPKLGKYMLNTVFEGLTIDDFRTGGEQKAKPDVEGYKEYYQRQQLEEKIETLTSKLTPELKEKFDAEFADLTEGKKLTKQNVDKYIKLTLKEIEPDFSSQEEQARIYSVGSSQSKPKAQDNKTDKATTDFLSMMGIIRTN